MNQSKILRAAFIVIAALLAIIAMSLISVRSADFGLSATAAESRNSQDVISLLRALKTVRTSPDLTASVNGKCEAKKGFVTYTQKIDGVIYRRDKLQYSRAVTSSKFVNFTHEEYNDAQNVAYRTGNSPITVKTVKEYAREYGDPIACPDGHTINTRTVTSAHSEETGAGKCYTFTVNRNSGCHELSVRMFKLAKLKEPPVFTDDPVFKLQVNERGEAIKLLVTDRYTVTVTLLGKINCTQTLDFTFDHTASANPYDIREFQSALGG